MIRDLRHGLRLLLQNKGWTLVVVLSVALGIGANTALFGAVNGLWFTTLGVDHPETLVRLKWAGTNDMGNDFSDYCFSGKDTVQIVRSTFSYPMFEQLRRASAATLSDLAAGAPRGQMNLVVDGQAEIVRGFVASGNFFQMLRVPALVGRTILSEDDTPSAPAVGVLSEGFWRRRFGASPAVVGKVVRLNNLALTIVGVTPARFTGIQQAIGTAPDITVPLVLESRYDNSGRLNQATAWWLQALGRLKPGVSAEQVQGSLDGLFQQEARSAWETYYASLNDAERSQSRNNNHTAVPHLRVDSAAHGIYDANSNDVQSVTLLSVVVFPAMSLTTAERV